MIDWLTVLQMYQQMAFEVGMLLDQDYSEYYEVGSPGLDAGLRNMLQFFHFRKYSWYLGGWGVRWGGYQSHYLT